MASLFRAYNAALLRRPMVAQCGTAAVLFGSGDLIAQQMIEKKGLKGHDWTRTARLTFYGGALFGPIFTRWYQLLNKIQFPSATKATAYRVALDQGVATPAHIAFFFTSMTLLEGHPFSDAKERLSHAYQPTLLRNWAVFLPTQIINFGIVPHQLRFLVVGVVSLFWNTYLSAVNAQQKAIEEESVKLE